MHEFQQSGVGQPLAPQGFFGSMLGAPLGGLFGNPQLGLGAYAGAGGRAAGQMAPFAFGIGGLRPHGW